MRIGRWKVLRPRSLAWLIVIARMDACSGAAKLESGKSESAKLESAKLELIMSFGEDRILRKSPEEIEKMRRSGKMVRQVLNHLQGAVAGSAMLIGLEGGPDELVAALGAGP